MSVSGEFQRVLGDTVQCLLRCQGDAATALAADLGEAGRVGRADLSSGAERVVSLLDGPQARPPFESELQREEFGEAAEHLRAICRAILGR